MLRTKLTRCQLGDEVRLYGFPGTYRVQSTTNEHYDFMAVPIKDGLTQPRRTGWGACEKSIVEINGEPVPCLSATLTPPARDYPHMPTFDYNDGPRALADEAVRRHFRLRKACV